MTQPGQPGYDPTIKDWANQYDVHENPNLHKIEQTASGNAEDASFASVEVGAWHNLGKIAAKGTPADKLLVMANADYEVFLAQDFAKFTRPVLDKSGAPIIDPLTDKPMTETFVAEDTNKRKICRFHPVTGDFQILGTSSPKYPPISNREHFINFGNAILDVAEPTVSTCGVLYDGKQAFMSWKLPKGVTIDGGDGADLWLVCHTSHDQSAPLTAAIVPIRPVCRNTLRVGMSEKRSSWTVKHTANVKLSLQAARDALKISYEYADEWMDLMEQLALTPITPNGFDALITDLWGPDEEASAKALTAWDERRGRLNALFTTSATAGGPNGWGALNAIGEFCDWEAKAPAAKNFQTDSGTGGEDGYKFWRSLMAEKSVTQPKQDALHALAEKAGFDTKLLTAKVV